MENARLDEIRSRSEPISRRDPQQPLTRQRGDFPPESDRAAEIAGEDGNRTGRIGRNHRHAGIDKRGKGEERAAARDGVEHAGREGRGGKKKIAGHDTLTIRRQRARP